MVSGVYDTPSEVARGSSHDAAIEFGSPSPIKQKFRDVQVPLRTQVNAPRNPSRSTQGSSIFLPRKDHHIPFRNGHAPHDSLQRSSSGRPYDAEKKSSPSTFPSLKIDYDPFEPVPVNRPQWKAAGQSLPSFKKKTTFTGPLMETGKSRAAPTPIRVPKEGETPYRLETDRKPPSMYDLSSRSPVKRDVGYYDRKLSALDEERSEPYTDPAKATEHLKSFLDETFQGEIDDDEDTALLDSDVVPGLNCRLLPHQISGVKFLKSRESRKAKINNSGGLLADDMGLGKTVQTMALIVSCPRPLEVKSIKSTLVVAPLSLIEQWAGEIKSKTKMSVYVHHGPSRSKNARKFGAYDIVMTTYNILVSEHNPALSARFKDDLDENEAFDDRGVFGVRWWRVVLDEAHTIKNRSAKMSIAACALRGVNRWCLTGTPIQNTVDELHSLLKFLRIEPLQDHAIFKEKINGPISRGKTRLAMKRLGAILSKIMIRRTKAVLNDTKNDENSAFRLPPRTVKHVCVEFSAPEREFYSGLEARADKTLSLMKQTGDVGYMSVLVLLQRLRQACNHTQLVTKSLDASEYKVDVKAMSPTKKEDRVVDDLADMFSGIGVSPEKAAIKDIKSLKCSICMCQLSLEEAGMANCAPCTGALLKARRQSDERYKTGSEPLYLDMSAKLERLMTILRDDEEPIDDDVVVTDGATCSPRKTIIFSQWTSMLDLVEPFLRAEGVGFVKYYGSMANKLREASLQALKTDPHCQVLLCSLKAGALGLNLTAASRVVMLDVWWNPAIEGTHKTSPSRKISYENRILTLFLDQAIDRVHRIGQTREVLVYKLTIKDTVEDRIVKLQEQKREIAKSVLGEGGNMMKLGLKELMDLFAREDN